MRTTGSKKDAGLTRNEQQVVISNVANRKALLLPAMGKTRNAPPTVICMNLQRQTGVSYHTYAADHSGFILVNYKTSSRWRSVQARIRIPHAEGYTGVPHARSQGDPRASDPTENIVYCPAYEVIQDNAPPFSWLPPEDTRKPRWSTRAEAPTSGGDPNRPSNNNKWIFSYSQNTNFGDKEFLFTDGSGRKHFDVFPTAKFEDLPRPGNTLLVAETWIDWGPTWGGGRAVYFNPNHEFEVPVLMADGHVSRHNKDNIGTLEFEDPTK